MRLLTAAVSATIAAGLLAACSGSNLGAGSSLPSMSNQSHVSQLAHPALSMVQPWMRPAGVARLHLNDNNIRVAAGASTIDASTFYSTSFDEFPNPNKGNAPATCTISGLSDVNGFGTDAKGNAAIPAFVASHWMVNVYAPKCGKVLWSAADSNGQPAGAVGKFAALTGPSFAKEALVGEIVNSATGAGAIEFCKKTGGCGTPFSNSAVTGYGGGVALASNGDCWLSAEKKSFSGFVMVYFKACKGTGKVVTGTSNVNYGGLFIDTAGHLGSVDLSPGTLYVYKGCNPKCTLVNTSTLHGGSIFCSLDALGKHLACGDYINSEVDVYTYSNTKGAVYSYSFNNGIAAGEDTEAAGFAPSNKAI